MIRSILKLVILLVILVPGFFLWKRSKPLAVIYTAGAIFLFVTLTVRANAPSDINLAAYDYLTRVNVTSTSALTVATGSWIPFNYPVNQLIADNFISQADADDILSVDSLSSFRELVGQGISGNPNPTFWLKAEDGDVPADTDRTFELHTGNSTVTHNYPLGLLSTDQVTVLDDVTLDITTRLTMESLGTTLDVIPTAYTPLVDQIGSYGLGVRSGNEVVAYVVDNTIQALNNVVDSNGDYINIDNQTGCAAGNHYQCVDDPVGAPDDAATQVHTNSAAELKDAYNVVDWALADTSEIIAAQIFFRVASNSITNCTFSPYLRLNGAETPGTPVTVAVINVWEDFSEQLANPDGGTLWTVSDLNALQAVIGITCDGAFIGRLTQVYLAFSYYPATESVFSPILVDTSYDFRATYDNVNLRLYVDDVLQDTDAFPPPINTGFWNHPLTVGPFSGEVHRSFAADTSNNVYVDDSANANNVATLSAITPRSVASTEVFGGGLSFYAADTQYGHMGSAATIDNIWDGGGTVEFCTYPTAVQNNKQILAKTDGASGWWAGTLVGPVETLQFDQGFTVNPGRWSAEGALTASEWHCYGISYNADAIGNDPLFYKDGSPFTGTVTETHTPAGVRQADGAFNLFVGARDAATNNYNGYIDEARIWDDIRTPAEILANWNVELDIVAPPAGLQAYHRFETTTSPADVRRLDFTYEPNTVTETAKGALGTLSLLTADAAIAQNDVEIADGALFAAGQDVTIDDDDSGAEVHVIASIAGNILTLVAPLGANFTLAQNADIVGDAWEWKGTVNDQSDETNDGTYLLTRTYVADLTVAVDSPTLKSVPTDPKLVDLIVDLVGDFDLPTDFSSEGVVGVNFPFADIFASSAASAGLRTSTLWIAFIGIIAYLIGLLIIKGTGQAGFGIAIMGLLVVLGASAGLYPPLFSIIAVVCYFGLFAWTRAFKLGET